MRKILTYTLVVLALFVFSAREARAQEISDASASFKASRAGDDGFDFRVENLRNFLLKFNSPLAPYAGEFVSYADANGIDYRLVPSISGVESTFGKNIPSPRSYNAYGWAGGEYVFKSWPDSINVVSSTLKNNYIERGAISVAQIARIYSPPSSTWGFNVQYFERKIDTLPLSFDLPS